MKELDYLQHWGILGQKWGKRNGPPYPLSSSQMSRAEKRMNKQEYKNLTIYERKYKAMGPESKSYRVVVDNKLIGEVDLFLKDKLETEIELLYVKKGERGKKYAQTILDWVITTQTKNGVKTLTLEVPNSSKDARHIYEKKGFREDGKIDTGGVWDGLTVMKKQLNKK